MILKKGLLESAFNMDALCLCLSAATVISFSSVVPHTARTCQIKKKKNTNAGTCEAVSFFFMIPISEGQTLGS